MRVYTIAYLEGYVCHDAHPPLAEACLPTARERAADARVGGDSSSKQPIHAYGNVLAVLSRTGYMRTIARANPNEYAPPAK